MTDTEKMKEEFAAELDKVFAEEFADIHEGIIVLRDDEGNDVEFEYLADIAYDGREFVVLFPVAEFSESCGVIILEAAKAENEEYENLIGVEDEETLMAVYNIFKEKFKDYFTFID